MGQPPPGQESGVTGTGQQFGPAQGEYHDTKRWAMTVSKATAREIVDNPPAADRQRIPGEPVFLRPSARRGSESLAALLTIYHSIPLAREALLLPNYQQSNYGYDPQWWTGQQIEASKIVSFDDQGAQYNLDDVIIETQRLMAFLDGTTRAYASVDALANLRSYVKKDADSDLSRFLAAWNYGAMIRSRDDPLTQVFSSHGFRGDPSNVPQRYFWCLEPMVNPEIEQTFVDILDNFIWCDHVSRDGSLNDIWLGRVGEIMTLKFSDPNRKQGKLGVEIPTVWYLDRYMEHFRERSRDMRLRRWHTQAEIRRLEHLRRSILTCTVIGRQENLDIKKVLLDAAERAPVVIKNQPSQITVGPTMSSPALSSADVNECVKGLQELVARIELKVAQIESIKEELGATSKAITAELTLPNADPPVSPYHRYTLRGVSTKENIVYSLRQADKVSPDSEPDGSISRPWQWWRISLSSEEAKQKPPVVYGPSPRPLSSSKAADSIGASTPYTPWPPSERDGNLVAYAIRKVSEEEVLKAAREEGDSVMLVYASDNAVNFQGSALSGPLQLFVKADNKVFDNELRGIGQPQEQDRATDGEEMTQLHFSNLDGMQDIPLINYSDETLNEEKINSGEPASSTLPARRGADGQPSPKRAKAEDDPPPYPDNDRPIPEMQERSGGMGILRTVQPNHAEKSMDETIDTTKDDAGPDPKGGKYLERPRSR
jgi:hypothetical protein